MRPGMLADRRTIVPNVAGLMTGVALFASFLAVLQYVQAPPDVTGYGFGASVLEASVVYLLPGGIAGIVRRAVRRPGGDPVRARCPRCWPGRRSGVAGFLLLALYRGEPWSVVLAGLLTQLSVTVAYAALPALVVQAVHEDETGVANAVNSIARSVGQALGSTVAVTLIAAGIDPATGFPGDAAYTQVALIGAAASRRGGRGRDRRAGRRPTGRRRAPAGPAGPRRGGDRPRRRVVARLRHSLNRYRARPAWNGTVRGTGRADVPTA